MLYEILTVAAVAVGATLASATIWSRKSTWVRGMAVAVWIGLMPLVIGSSFFSLGHPAPWIQNINAPGGEYFVLGVKMVQDEAIYIWLDFGAGYPRYFALPWNNDTANQLQDLMDKQGTGKIPGFALDIPYEWSWDENAPQFHPLPQPKLMPDKVEPQAEPKRYDRSA